MTLRTSCSERLDIIKDIPTKELRELVKKWRNTITLKELQEIVKQLESCGYECDEGKLEMNKAFGRLKEFAYRRKAEEV